ncbi:hypothetical protein KUTeg_021561 [Tegillarca granosa]|uniref:Secreted protein n=1 Tax=Tegillarca granosa TaxID=220873 RepID=A0ABQ9E909_TEGGR|nr:hypothetical protein KUTeg_021561 [Tegillarca granosa]
MDLKGVFHKTEMIRFVVGAALLVVVYCQIQPQAQPVIGTPRALLQTIAVRGNDNRGSGLFSSNRPFTNAYSTGHLCVYYVTCASRKVLFVYTCTEAKRKVVKILTFGTNL